jgi:hypothetical protein
MQKLTITHVRNWQKNRRRVGYVYLPLAAVGVVTKRKSSAGFFDFE